MEQFRLDLSERNLLLWRSFKVVKSMPLDTGNVPDRQSVDVIMLNVSLTDRVVRK